MTNNTQLMKTNSTITTDAYAISSVLNKNRVCDEFQRESLLSMGLSVCQVGCMGGGQRLRYYRAAH